MPPRKKSTQARGLPTNRFGEDHPRYEHSGSRQPERFRPSRSLLNLITGSEHILVLSQNLLYELEEVLRYAQIRRLTRLKEGQIAEYVGLVPEVAELVDIGPPIPFPTPDADDWTVLRTAIHGDVDVLCSLDGHLRRYDLATI
jgi:predicted nucleic acid-binding protein